MRHLYPIITTHHPLQCRDFYLRAFNARILFQQDWYVHLSVDGWEIGFVRPDPPTRLPMFQHAALSRGVCVALEVSSVHDTHRQMTERGIELLGPLQIFPGGDVSFSVMDPAGVVINIVERHPDPATQLM